MVVQCEDGDMMPSWVLNGVFFRVFRMCAAPARLSSDAATHPSLHPKYFQALPMMEAIFQLLH